MLSYVGKIPGEIQQIDYAKKLIDECAPGGGYIFSTGIELLTKTDVIFDNLVATHQFVHEYGRK